MGNVSLFAIDTDDGVAKIGYRVHPDARGRGVARQMVDAVTRWAFTERGLARVQLEHAVPNLASCKVAARGRLRCSRAPRGRRTPCRAEGREDCHIHGRLATDPGSDSGRGASSARISAAGRSVISR